MSCRKTTHTHTHTYTHTNLFLVADPVGRLQALLQEGQAQFVYGWFVEVILHKTVKSTESSQKKWAVTINRLVVGNLHTRFNVFVPVPSSPVLLDNINKVSVAPLPEVLGAEGDECWVVHAHGSTAPCLLLLLLQHLTQWRLAVLQGCQLRTEQAIQSLWVVPWNRWRTLQIWRVLRSRHNKTNFLSWAEQNNRLQ